jgi:hypothetical protein
MRFRVAVKLSKGHRYIQRDNGRTLFDVIRYNPDLLGDDDLVADDWNLLINERINYFDK